MTRTRLKLVALAMVFGGLFWGQRLIASNRDAACELLYPGTQTCLNNSCCVGIPENCTTMCAYNDILETCTCERIPPG
jgi:hypothetical protein